MWYPTLRPVLFALDPERAHRLALEALRQFGRRTARPLPGTPVTLMGLRFANRVGLAAGFDKNATAVDGLGALGFGYIEIGTVTPRAQPGQPRPRLFRLPGAGALINRLGFPNDGARAVAERLRRRRYRGIVGVNIGKNATTPLHRAVEDYVSCLRAVAPVADYVAINISSPNTESLRELHEPRHLAPFLAEIVAARDSLSVPRRVPLLLKVSPDLATGQLLDVAGTVHKAGIDGVIATNTTVRRHGLNAGDYTEGGLSGAPLHPVALRTVSALRQALGPEFPIVGVGGISSVADALAMRAAGADLIQLYTGLVYRGPSLVARCARALAGS